MIKRLPDAEFEVMKIIWDNTPPVTTLKIMEELKGEKDWKPQTVLTILVRLIEKGFLKSERVGRERNYSPVIKEKDYMRVETGDFIKRYSGNSIGTLVKALYNGKSISEQDLQELENWIKKRSK